MTLQAVAYKEGAVLDYTAGANKIAGDVVQVANLCGVLTDDVASGAVGSAQIGGLFRVRKVNGAIAAGDEVWWDADGDPQGDTAGIGAATKLATAGDVLMGKAIYAAGATDTHVVVAVNSHLAGNLADGGLVQESVIEKSFGDDATGDVVLLKAAPFKLRVLDALVENRAANGANANTIQVCKSAAGADAITDAMSLNAKVDTDIVRAAKVDDANAVIAAGSPIYIRQTKAGGTMGGVVRVKVVPVA